MHWIEFMIQGYINIFGYFFWPILFTGWIAYIYAKNKSATTAAVGILIICAGFGATGVFTHTPIIVMFYQFIVAMAITGLVVIFFTRRRG